MSGIVLHAPGGQAITTGKEGMASKGPSTRGIAGEALIVRLCPRACREGNVRIGDITSFNQLVGTANQRIWDRDPQGSGRLEVDRLEQIGHLLHRHVGGLFALWNSTCVVA